MAEEELTIVFGMAQRILEAVVDRSLVVVSAMRL